jgi:hypothetical protein
MPASIEILLTLVVCLIVDFGTCLDEKQLKAYCLLRRQCTAAISKIASGSHVYRSA